MKRLLIIALLLMSTSVYSQNVSRYDNIAIGNLPGGNLLQALPNAVIQVSGCSSMSTSCTLPANLCSSITDTVCSLPGYLTADSGGNFHFYGRAGRYQVTISASGFQTRTINDVILPISASDGGGVGTSVTVNGTTAVPNQLNFTNTLLPPAGSTVVNFLLNGNTVGAYVTGGGGGGGTPFTVNGVTPTGIVNFNASNPLPPPNGINVNWSLVGTNLTAAVVGDGNPNSCLLGTGHFAACPGGGGGGGGTPLPTIPQYNLFASTGAGAAQDSAVKAGPPGFLQAEVITATGDVSSAPAPFQLFPNASVEYFPTGYSWSGGTAGATNGFAGYFSHSSGSTASTNGGIGLGGGNSSGSGNQLYLDCETTGCGFTVPINVNTVSGNGISMTSAGGPLPTLSGTQGGLGIGSNGVPMMNVSNGGWVAIPQSTSSGSVAWGSITGTLSTQADLQTALNAKLGLASTLAPTTCSTGQAAAGILANGNATGCFTPAGGGGGTGSPNQSVSFTSVTTASLTVTSATTALVWSCWDGPTFPANAIYPSNVTVSSAGLVTFTFAVQQSGYCVVNSTGSIGAAPPVTFTNATSATVTASGATPLWACWDTATPANAIYPSNVSVDPSTYLVTFTFAVPQTGQCVVSGAAAGGGGGGATTSAVSCAPSADLVTFTARTTVCSLALPAGTARQWIVNCNLIWNRQNDGTAATTITARLNLNNAPTAASFFTTETWASGGPVFGNIQLASGAGDTTFVTPSSANGDLTVWSFVFHGTIMAPAGGETAAFSLQSSNGTGALRLGSACTAQ